MPVEISLFRHSNKTICQKIENYHPSLRGRRKPSAPISLIIQRIEIASSSAVQRIPRKFGLLGQTGKLESMSLIISYCKYSIPVFMGIAITIFSTLIFVKEMIAESARPLISRLENGMDVVLIPNHSVKMIAANFIIKVGARDEDWETWGAAHFLEHLLFNGTANRSQEEIYTEFDQLGAYHNAHTGSHFTDFMLLTSNQKFLPALSIMADMIFSSTLPRWKFEKERGIVIEEIARSSPDDYRAAQVFKEKLFQNTSLSRSILGTANSISDLERDRVLDFYHSWYTPNNMLLFVTGDFDPDAMIGSIFELFNIYSPRQLPVRTQIDEPDFARFAQQRFVRVSRKIKKSSVIIGQAAPLPSNPDFATILFLRDLLERRMEKYFSSGIHGTSDFIFDHDLCVLKIEISFPDSVMAEEVIDKFDSIIDGMISHPSKQKEIDQLAKIFRADEIFTSERLHYYGVMNSAYWALTSFEEFRSWHERMSNFTPVYLKQKTAQWLRTDERLIMSFEPGRPSPIGAHDGFASSTESNQIRRFESFDFPVMLARTDRSARVFAMHILFRDRWKWDEKYGASSVDILHRLIMKGMDKRGKSVSEQLDEISGNLKTFDSAFIPYDDYYTTAEYSYLRFETLPEHWEAGVELIFDLLQNIPVDQHTLNEARQASTDAYSQRKNNPTKAGRQLLRSTLMPNTGLSAATYGDNNDLNPARLSDLKSEFFAAANLIVSVSSPIESEDLFQKIRDEFTFPKLTNSSVNHQTYYEKPALYLSGIDTLILEKSQGAIVMGKVLLDIIDEDRLPLIIANAHLNEKLAMILREQRGLAYSLGSRIIFRAYDQGNIWAYWEISVGTRQENLAKVKSGIFKIINDLQQEFIKIDTIKRLSSSLAGRQMMRSMARIRQAYSVGTGEFYWQNPEAGINIDAELDLLDEDEVNRAARKFLNHEGFHIIIVR